MTDFGDSSSTALDLRVGGVSMANLADAVIAADKKSSEREEAHRFWASRARPITNTNREILELSFGSRRLVNHLSFKASRFPLKMTVEYLGTDGRWWPVTYAERRGDRPPRRPIPLHPVQLEISESVPHKVDSAQATRHPQHFGKSHWAEETWRITPVSTRRLRFIFVRNQRGTPPVDFRGRQVPYSVALKDLTVGYRVTSRSDIPPPPAEDWWASTKDILGSQVVLTTYEQPATKAVDGNDGTYWRSEPQPFPFAVVNFYLDLTEDDGNVPVIDRFWVNPVTAGVLCNLYYSDSFPEAPYQGESDPIPVNERTEYGNPIPVLDPSTSTPTAIDLGPDTRTGVDVANSYLRVEFDEPWWVGVDATSLVAGDGPDSYPLVTVGDVRVYQQGGYLRMLLQSGEETTIPLDPTLHMMHSNYRVVASYHLPDPAQGRDAYLRLAYQLRGFDPIVAEVSVPPVVAHPGGVKIGLHPDPSSTDAAAISIKGLVLKSEALTEDAEEWFFEDGSDFVLNPLTDYTDDGRSQNAKIRMHPAFRTDANLFGVVGGPGNLFSEMEWTPISRDYSLRQGFMQLPPTRARYWKFEMTGLVPQVYDNFITIDREVLVFPPDVVAQSLSNIVQDNSSAPMGSSTLEATSGRVLYDDAIAALSDSSPPVPADSTQVLVIRNPQQAQRAAETGWIWNYQPWHIGTSAPQFIGIGRHHYESLDIQHTTKVAYFAGIKEIRPVKVNYTLNDDTAEYVEHFGDQSLIDSASGVEFHPEGGLTSISGHAEVVSVDFPSYQRVRGLQFATQETGPIQVFAHPSFDDPTLTGWNVYGDASMQWLGRSDVRVTRGWFSNTYGDLETKTYGDLEAGNWGQVEGNAQSSGMAEGGVQTNTFESHGAGRMIGMAKISATATLDQPVALEIVSTYGNRVVARDEQRVAAGETVDFSVTYTAPSLSVFRTYAEVENLVSTSTTYGDLEAFRYFQLESSQVQAPEYYLRIRQDTASRDVFHVHRVAIYDTPVAWYFSNDGGLSWFQALGIQDDPHGVLIFPESLSTDVGVGTTLKWKAVIYREDTSISGLYIRPWYGNRSRPLEPTHYLASIGPNRSPRDTLPLTSQHPMWQPIPLAEIESTQYDVGSTPPTTPNATLGIDSTGEVVYDPDGITPDEIPVMVGIDDDGAFYVDTVVANPQPISIDDDGELFI